LINCLVCIDLNPLRAGLVDRPEEYRWNSLGYHIQTGNKDNFLSLDFGLKEFGVLDGGERLKGYRRYVIKPARWTALRLVSAKSLKRRWWKKSEKKSLK
jgi:hypothetical protein